MTDDAQRWALMTVELTGDDRSLAAAAQALHVPDGSLDASFGLVPLDASRGLYAVQVRAEDLPAGQAAERYSGPFSNPPIAPFSMQGDD